MKALLAVEIRRILSRRLARLVALLLLTGIAIAGVVTYLVSTDGPHFHLVDLMDVFKGSAVGLATLSWIVAASAIGADWQSGTLKTTLTWEPRRAMAVLFRSAAAATVAFVATLVALALLGFALLPAALDRGATNGADGAWAWSTTAAAGRVSSISAVAAVAATAIATLGRRTSAALGFGFVYFAILEGAVRGAVPDLQRWLIADNAAVIVEGHDFVGVLGRTPAEAASYLAVCAAALVAVAVIWFRRTDVP